MTNHVPPISNLLFCFLAASSAGPTLSQHPPPGQLFSEKKLGHFTCSLIHARSGQHSLVTAASRSFSYIALLYYMRVYKIDQSCHCLVPWSSFVAWGFEALTLHFWGSSLIYLTTVLLWKGCGLFLLLYVLIVITQEGSIMGQTSFSFFWVLLLSEV